MSVDRCQISSRDRRLSVLLGTVAAIGGMIPGTAATQTSAGMPAAPPPPRKAAQISHELTFPMRPGPREWVVGREVVIRFKQPESIPADLVSLSVDGKQLAVFGPASSYTWDANELSNGPHKLRIAAQTASGRETWAVEQTVIVDNRPPAAAPPAPSPAAPARSAKAPRKAPAKKNPARKPS